MKSLNQTAAALCAAGVFASQAATISADDPPPRKVAGKKLTIKDMRKGIIELPVKRLFAKSKPHVAEAKRPTSSTDTFENPTVKPGDVRWHSDFNTAIAKAKRSKKPVLLFQLIGRLDQRFS